MQQYEWLIARLDAFIRKYYINQLIRGGLILLICLLAFVLAASIGEYFLYLPVWIKVILAAIFIIGGSLALIFWMIIPLLRINKLGKVIAHEEAAVVIGKHFPEVSDKLLNLLQLKNTADATASRELIEASINQKASQISIVPINKAVDLTKNKRFLPWLLPLMLAGIFILFAAPNIFKDASQRLLSPTTSFEKPAPFSFNIKTLPLVAIHNSDFILKADVSGKLLPQNLSIEVDGEQTPMTDLGNHQFQYTFKNVTNPLQFRLVGGGYKSAEYTLDIAQKPLLKSLKINIDYPEYTKRKDETKQSLGDLSVPEGTTIKWEINTQYTDTVKFTWQYGARLRLAGNGGKYSYFYRFPQDSTYTISLHNKQTSLATEYRYNVQVTPDKHPVISMQQFRDSLDSKHVLLQGNAGDDYGLTKVAFHYNIFSDKGKQILSKSIILSGAGNLIAPFKHYFDIEALHLQKSQKVEFFIEAWDNDGIHGPKATRSEIMSYHMFTPNQLDSAINANAQQVNSSLSNSAKQSKQLQQELKSAKSNMLQNNSISYEQQQQVRELMQQQQNLQQQIEKSKKLFEEQVQQSLQKEYSEEIREKQEEVKKQLDNLLNNELKEQMKKLEELMKRLNKENAVQTAEQLEQENKLFNMDLQRMQELMQQLEMQMRMEDLANKLDNLAEKQGDLKKQNDSKNPDNKSLANKQNELKKELDKLMNEDMKDIKELNKKTGEKQDLQKSDNEGKKASEQMDKSSEELEKNDNNEAGEKQNEAKESLEKMANDMREQSGGMEMKQIDINIKATRQILTNLMRLSFDEEKLMNTVKSTATSSNVYIANMKEQQRLYTNARMIKDSLFSLSKRVFKLAPTINKETSELEHQLKYTTADLEARNINSALTRQQYVMTHTNNLALMLNELLTNLFQMQSKKKQSGKGACGKPGGMNPKPGVGKQLSDIITKQQQLGQKAGQKPGEQPSDKENGEKDGDKGKNPGEKEGQQPGGKTPGQQPGENGGKQPGGKKGNAGGGNNGGEGNSEGNNEYGNAEQLARMANEQAAIRRQLQELQNKLNGNGSGVSKELREIQQQMDKNETDFVNRRINTEFVKRQQEILTKLLQAEKSLREQEEDEKRSSNAGKEVPKPMPAELEQRMLQNQQLLDIYRTIPPQLKPYYRSMVDSYFRSIGNR